MKKWMIPIIYAVFLIWGLLNRDIIIFWFKTSDPSYFFMDILLSAFIATFPFIPFTLFGGLVGLKYGLFIGLLLNWFGMFTAALLYYILSRYFLIDYFNRKIKHDKRLGKLQIYINQNAFLAILILRLIPIIPPFVVHIYSGVSRIGYCTYMAATALGLIPPMFILAYSGNQLLTNLPHFVVALFLYGLLVISILFAYKVGNKGKWEAIRE